MAANDEGIKREKRARIVSEFSEISEEDNDVELVKGEGDSPGVVIYEMSSDNDESLLNEKPSSNDVSPVLQPNEESDNESVDDEMKSDMNSVKDVDDNVDGKTNVTGEKRKRLESSDYITKTMEDLEDLQEDLHKELAQITEKSSRKGKSRKDHRKRDKHQNDESFLKYRNREKDTRIRQKDRTREREQQRKNDNRSESRREGSLGTRHDKKGQKYHDVDFDKPWSYDSRKLRTGKTNKHEDRHWMDLRKDIIQRNEKSIVEKRRFKDLKKPKEDFRSKEGHQMKKKMDGTDVRHSSKDSKISISKDQSESKDSSKIPKEHRKSAQVSKEPVQKGIMSDSMRELVRQSLKESKGFSQEVVEEESDESPQHIHMVQASDVSSASDSDRDDEAEDMIEQESSPELPKLPPYFPAIQGCRSVEEFQWLNRIEEGTYGVVYRAKDKRTGEVVALKKLKMEKEKEGFPITSLREINTLLKAQHPNIVTVQEIVVGSNMDKIYIVMDFVEHDLKALMETMTQPFLAGEIKTIMIQLLRAVNHLHDNWILHRDIKTSNLLLSNKGVLKVGDFGLAREYGSPLKYYTPVVVTLWYRAPELLLGAKEYWTPIDIWSVGCVFAELLTMKPLFNGQTEISQINKIFKELGTPSDKIWPGPPAYSEHPAVKKITFSEYPYNNLRNKFGATLTDNGFDLLNSFLTYDPQRRIMADAALRHNFFKEAPSPVDPSHFPSWPARSEGSKRAKKASPKAPEGGDFYKSLSEDGEKSEGSFHMPVGKSQGKTAVPAFTLRF